jgi:hypothetical protein
MEIDSEYWKQIVKAANIVNSFLVESNPLKTMSRRKNAATLFLTLSDYRTTAAQRRITA